MATTLAQEKKEERIVIRCDAAFKERVDRIARIAFGENRSYMTRKALEDLLAQYESDERSKAA